MVQNGARLATESEAQNVVNLLVELEIDVNATNARGRIPLDVGTVSRPLHPDTATLLRGLGATSRADGTERR